MLSSVVLLSLLVICQANVLPPGPNCVCYNPFEQNIQHFFAAKNVSCEHSGVCYVDCASDCGDVRLQTGFAAKESRCISKAACHVESENSSKSKFADEAKSSKSQFVLSGTGEVAEYQGNGLGLYTLNNSTGYYVQEGGDYYLVRDREEWFTFPRKSGCTETGFSCIAMYVANLKTRNLTGEPWYFGKNKEWVIDETIKFIPLNTSSSCLMCKTVVLSSSGPAMQARPEYFGTFERTSHFSAGRPVYRSKKGKFLMMMNEYTTFSVWDDMERTVSAGKGVEGVRGVRSQSGPTCVTDFAGKRNPREQEQREMQDWEFLSESGEWVADPSITVQTDC